jgi:alanine dehydrogenase
LVLLLRRSDIEDLIDLPKAIEVMKTVALEEVKGTAVHMPTFGGNGGPRRVVRAAGGGLWGLDRFSMRAGGLAMLTDMEGRETLAVLETGTINLRLSAMVALAASYLANPQARVVGMIGSGTTARATVLGLCEGRPIEQVLVFSPTEAHRQAFAEHMSGELGIPVRAAATADEAIEEAEILGVATNSRSPTLTADRWRPGVHVSSVGVNRELDRSVYEAADQIVTASRAQQIALSLPSDTPGRLTGGPIADLLGEGVITTESFIELGDLVGGTVAPRNRASDRTLFLDSRGGVADTALVNYVYERAREQDRGVEFSFRE